MYGNRIIDIKVSGDGAEPFDVVAAKKHMIVESADDDAYITALITACRKAIENYTNASLVTKDVVLTIDFCEELELPYGPVDEISEVKIRTGTDGSGAAQYEVLSGDEYTTDGESYKLFNSSRTGRHKITYTTLAESGEDLILAIKQEVSYRYEHRGDETQTIAAEKIGVCEAARILADPYRRLAWV